MDPHDLEELDRDSTAYLGNFMGATVEEARDGSSLLILTGEQDAGGQGGGLVAIRIQNFMTEPFLDTARVIADREDLVGREIDEPEVDG